MDRAALLEATGVDTNDVEQEQQHEEQQQQLGAAELSAAATTPVTDVQALSAVEQPLLGSAGQQQQEEAAADASADEGEDEELDDDMAYIARLLKQGVELEDHKERMFNILTGAGGLSPEDAMDVIDQPEAVLANMSWLPMQFIDPDDDSDSDDDDEQQQHAAGQEEGEGGEAAGDEEPTVSLLQLAHACANDALTPDQTEWILSEAERHNLPLMLNEDTGKLIWPGTAEYNDWAKDEPEAAEEDQQVLRAALEEVFADEWAAAEAQADEFLQLYTNEDGSFKEPSPEEATTMDHMAKLFLSRLATEDMMTVEEAGEGEADEAEFVATIDPSAAGPVDLDSELAELQEQLGPILAAKKAELDLEKLAEMGLPVEEFFKDTPSSIMGGSKKLSS